MPFTQPIEDSTAVAAASRHVTHSQCEGRGGEWRFLLKEGSTDDRAAAGGGLSSPINAPETGRARGRPRGRRKQDGRRTPPPPNRVSSHQTSHVWQAPGRRQAGGRAWSTLRTPLTHSQSVPIGTSLLLSYNSSAITTAAAAANHNRAHFCCSVTTHD